MTGSDRPLTVVSESPWVAPGQNFDLHLRIGGTVPAGDLGLTVNVYPCLSSVSAFDQSLSTSTLSSETPISSTPAPLPVSGLPVVSGGVDLSLPVVVGTGDGSPAPGGSTIDLSAAGDECGAYPTGVYPVWVQLVDLSTSNRQIVAQFTTHLIYTNGDADTQRLRVAIVLPVDLPALPSPSPSPSQLLARPGAAVASPSDAEVAGIDATLGVLDTSPTSAVPVTVDASPLTVQLLAQSGHAVYRGRPGRRGQRPVGPPIPVGPVRTGQRRRPGRCRTGQRADHAGQHEERPCSGTGVTHSAATVGLSDLGAWVTNDALDSGSIGQLATLGYSQVVLPSASVTAPPADGSTTEPFSLPTAHGHQVTAITSNADLSARFAGSAGDAGAGCPPASGRVGPDLLREAQRLHPPHGGGGGSQRMEGQPHLRGRSAVRAGRQPDHRARHHQGPVRHVRPGSRLSRRMPTAIHRLGCGTAGRRASAPSASGSPGLPRPFGGLRPGSSRSSSETWCWPASRRTSAPRSRTPSSATPAAALNAQLSQLQVAGDRTVTLTSQQGTLPVTIVSSTSYPVTGTLTLTSDKLLFPNGTTEWTQPVSLVLPNNVVDVKVRARASGVFKVDVSLHSPAGGLELSNGEVEVRSTATSVVGIVLSVGALTVLVVWWFRTSRKRRALREAEEGADLVSETP